jgi:hypothetical protein
MKVKFNVSQCCVWHRDDMLLVERLYVERLGSLVQGSVVPASVRTSVHRCLSRVRFVVVWPISPRQYVYNTVCFFIRLYFTIHNHQLINRKHKFDLGYIYHQIIFPNKMSGTKHCQVTPNVNGGREIESVSPRPAPSKCSPSSGLEFGQLACIPAVPVVLCECVFCDTPCTLWYRLKTLRQERKPWNVPSSAEVSPPAVHTDFAFRSHLEEEKQRPSVTSMNLSFVIAFHSTSSFPQTYLTYRCINGLRPLEV